MATRGNSTKRTSIEPAGKAAMTGDTVRPLGARTRQRSEADLAALTRLHELSTRLLTVDGLQPLFQEIMDTAVALVEAERGTLQLLEGESLRIVAHHGHQPPFLKFFAAAESQASACGETLKRGERVIVEDVTCSPLFVGTLSAKVLREAGVRAVQSTPLRTRQGKLLGILTTQWSVPHIPDEHDLWQLDLLARQGADLIEHKQAEEALRNANEELRVRAEQLETLNDSLWTRQKELETANEDLRAQEEELRCQSEALRQSEQRYRALFETAPDAIVVHKDGRFLDANEAALHLTGAGTFEELAKHTVLDFFRPEDREPAAQRIREATAGRRLPIREATLRRLDGQEAVVEFHTAPVDFHGVQAIQTIIRDITERQQAEEALRESEIHLARAQEIAHLGGWSWDLVADRLYWSDEIYRLYGLRPGESVPRHEAFLRFIHPEDRARVEQRVQEGLAQGGPCQFDFRIVRPGGEERYVHCEAHTLLDAQGHPLRAEGVLQDITDRKRAEEVLRIKESAIASSLNAIAMADPQGHLTYVNPAFLKLWGYDNESEVLGKSAADFWKEPEQALEVMRAIQNGQGWVGELTAVTKDGAHLRLYLSASAVRNEAGALTCMMASFLDITVRQQTEDALRESRTILKTIIESTPDYISLKDREGRYVMMNSVAAERLRESTGVSAAEIIGKRDDEILPCATAGPVIETDRQVVTSGTTLAFDQSFTLRHERRTFSTIKSPYRDLAGNVAGVVNFSRDITERQRAEEALRASEQRYRNLFEANVAGVYLSQLDGTILDCNDAMVRMVGCDSREEVLGRRTADFYVHPELRQGLVHLLQRDGAVPPREALLRQKDGVILHVFGSAVLLANEQTGEPYVQGVVIDITQRMQAEEALRAKEAELQLVADATPVLLTRLSRDLRYVFANRACAEWFGRPPDEIVGKPIVEVMGREAFETIRPYVERVLRGERVEYEAQIPYQGIGTRFMHVTYIPERNAQSEVMGWLASVLDVTARKQAEEALREAHARAAWLARFPEENPSPVLRVSAEGVVLYRNPATAGKPGWTCEIGQPLEEPFVSLVRRALAEGRQATQDVELGGRSYAIWVSPVASERYANIYGGDITDRKRAEEDTRRRAEELATLMDLTPTAVWVSTGARCEVITGNRAAQRFYAAGAGDNLSAGAIGGPQDCTRRFFQNGRELRPEELPMQVAAAQGIDVRDSEIDVLLPSGRTITILGNASPLFDAEGRVRGSVAAFVDITERKRAEQALREWNVTLESRVAERTAELERERQRLYAVLEAMPAMVCLLTPDYHVAFANRSFREQFGEANGRHCYEFCFGRTEPCAFCEAYQVLKTGKPHRWEVISRDGRTIIDAHDFPFTDVDGSPLILEMDLDITERKRAEAALKELNETLSYRARQLQRLTLELTQAEERERRRIALILHEDLQQQIAGAKFHLNLVRSRVKEDRPRAAIDTVETMLRDAIEKSRTLSRDLSPAVLHMNDLAELVQWLTHRLRAQQGLSVRLDIAGDMMLHSEALGTFLFRAAQEMLFNVVKHAQVREAVVRIRRLGRYVGLSVSDRGEGFDPQELQETSGMGLFSIRERTELLGGRLKVKSAQGQGSRFRLTVPDSAEDRERRTENRGQKTEDRGPKTDSDAVLRPPSSVLRVLLVDDHEVVRAGLAALLREAPGIELVGEAPDGRTAINLAIDLRPDVVIMDVSMPLMSGAQATRQIKTRLPQTRVLALSMYDEAEKKQQMFEAGAEGYILKTVSAEDLLAALRGPGSDS